MVIREWSASTPVDRLADQLFDLCAEERGVVGRPAPHVSGEGGTLLARHRNPLRVRRQEGEEEAETVVVMSSMVASSPNAQEPGLAGLLWAVSAGVRIPAWPP